MEAPFDVAIVGSGPSGALAALKLVDRGRNVLLLDVGFDDDRYRKMIPDEPFSVIRRSDPEQRRYFLGDHLEGIPLAHVRVGAQLTPPRQFVIRGTEEHLPVSGQGFDPMQSLALGGLGAAWGAAIFTYSRRELELAGIYEPDFDRYYDEVSQTIGISAEPEDDTSLDCFSGVAHHLPALDLDSVATCIRSRYVANRESFLRDGFSLGGTPLAVLSRDYEGRRANPYFDMDFWSESRQSVFRPRYLIEDLMKRPNFRLERGRLVTRFHDEGPLGVEIRCRDIDRETTRTFRARRLLLCAGAINSARIALNSLGLVGKQVPILCNPYTYVPCVCMSLLGREVADRRHSLSQLVAIYKPEEASDDVVTTQFYSYRSLLLFKLVKEIPLPPWAGLLISRLLVNSMAILGIHHSDSPSPGKNMRILASTDDVAPELCFDFARSPNEELARRRREQRLLRLFFRLGLIPLSRLSPGAASSIHYAGTIPVATGRFDEWGVTPAGQLLQASNVYVGDSATWRYLPSKGLTFTLMANALRVAERIDADLEASS
jgi:choline dehydrogenase-like flavoprotein